MKIQLSIVVRDVELTWQKRFAVISLCPYWLISSILVREIYLPTFSEIWAWDFYPGSAGIFEDDTIVSEDSQRSPKSSEDMQSPSPSLRMCINASSIPVLFTSKIRDRAEGIVMYSFYTWFLFLTWVWVNIFLEIVSSKMATTHIFQSGVRNWPASVSRCEIEVFNPQAWDSRLRHESWQVWEDCDFSSQMWKTGA